MHVFSETVEKPQKLVFRESKYLILLHPNLGKLQKLGFFNSLSINDSLSDILFSGKKSEIKYLEFNIFFLKYIFIVNTYFS
jgi:hypothetical protein